MKKFLAILILATLTVAGIAADRTLLIRPGSNIVNQPGYNASDSIITSATYNINITNVQRYAQNQVFTFTLTDVDGGSPSVAVTAYGRVSANGAWVQIGSPITWTSTGNNPSTISSTAPVNYNYLKVAFVASGATQHLKIATFDCRTSNAFEVPTSAGTITLSRPTSGTVTLQTADNDANAAAVYRAGGSGALTLGAATGTTAITSSDWAIDATGIATGLGALTSNGLITTTAGLTVTGAAVNLNASSNFAVNVGTGTTNAAVSIGGGSNTVAINSTALDISTTGEVTGATDITATGIISGGIKLLAPIACTDGSETLDVTMSGKIVVCSSAGGATTVTIPDPSAATVGVIYYIVQTADQDLVLTATTANSNSIVCDHIATTDNVTISTSSHKIGSGMFVIGISATKWFVGGLNPESLLTPEAAD